MAELINSDRIVVEATHRMLEGQPGQAVAYDHGPRLTIGMAAARSEDGQRLLKVERSPGYSLSLNLETATAAELGRLAAAVRGSSNGAHTPRV